MSTRNNKKTVRFLPLALAFQMVLPVQAFAEDNASDSQRESQAMSKTAGVLSFLNGMGQEFIQAHQQRLQQAQAQQAVNQLNQTLGIKPVDPSQVPPIISQNGCAVLQARSEQISSNMSCEGPFDINLMMAGHYDALLNVAETNVNDLENFLTEGHERFTTQGVGCYDKARNQLQQQLNGRLEMLEQMKQSIDERVAAFEKLAEKDLKDIKKGDALLNGTKSSKDEATKAAMKDFKWESKFNDPACKSLIGTNFNAMGTSEGFRGIEDLLTKNRDAIGAEKFLSQRNQIEKEIRSIAKEAAKQVRREDDIPGAQEVLGGIRSRDFSTSSKALVQSFNIVAKKAQDKQNDLKKKLDKVVGQEKGLEGFSKAIVEDTADVEKALYEWEKSQKNACVAQHFKREFGSVEGFLSKIEDPNISKKANREADSAFKNYVQQILEDDRYSVEEKMQKIAAKQGESNNSRYGIVSGRSFTVQGKQVGASTRLRAKDMVNLFGQDCKNGFESDDRVGGHSGREMVNALKNYAVETKKAKEQFANNIETEIIAGLVDCPDQSSVGSAANTCDKESTNKNSAKFCVRTANTCSANALSCLDKAKKIVEQTRVEQQAIATRYKANMDKLKADLIAEFKTVKANFEASSRQIDGLFQMGTTYKKDEFASNLELNFTTKELMKGVDESLAIEDPAAYKKKVADNIKALKTQVTKHNKDVIAGYDKEINKYKKNYGKELKNWAKVAKECSKKVGQEYAKFVNDKNQREIEEANKFNEPRIEACNKYRNFKSNPCPSGSGSEFGDLGNDIASIAASANDMQAANQIRSTIASCDAFGNEDGTTQYFGMGTQGSTSSSKFNITLEEFCADGGIGPSAGVTACQRVTAQKDEYKRYLELDTCSTNHLGTAYEESNKPYCLNTSGTMADPCPTDWEAKGMSKISKNNVSKLPDGIKKELYATANCVQEDSGFMKRYEDAREEALEALAQYKRSEFNAQVGQIQVAACESGNNSDPSMPDFSNPDNVRGLAGDLMRAGMGVTGY